MQRSSGGGDRAVALCGSVIQCVLFWFETSNTTHSHSKLNAHTHPQWVSNAHMYSRDMHANYYACFLCCVCVCADGDGNGVFVRSFVRWFCNMAYVRGERVYGLRTPHGARLNARGFFVSSCVVVVVIVLAVRHSIFLHVYAIRIRTKCTMFSICYI